MTKIYEILRLGSLACYCVGFVPSDKSLGDLGLARGRDFEVVEDVGGQHAVFPVFVKDEKGKDTNTVALLDFKYERENQYTPVNSFKDTFIFRNARDFFEYFTD